MSNNGDNQSALFWLAYTPDTTDEEARRMFEERHGRQPEKVRRCKALVLAGPLERGEIREC